ncbi:transposase DNA-binding-containing protein [Zoogloea sp.]|uniref:IS4/Tn5 family transposase DNA-binding protein n=1 Tax=Zoogloea sp. TaxID=49181 RepID=UPI0026339C8C|nr:transposase DNA-binding-containing protein [Zoogloea sp.]MDD3355070.1 transposase DNA-binding-containing protein [Zoogloea sp.]
MYPIVLSDAHRERADKLAKQEFETIDLGDARLNQRAVLLAERLGQKPGASIPGACENWAETARALPKSRHVCIGDRESDMLSLLVKARNLDYPADYLVRCQHNRALPEGDKLWERVMAGAPLGCVRFELPAGRGRKARSDEQALRTERIELAVRQSGTLEVTCLIATEINAPAGSKPVCWCLLTNRAAPSWRRRSSCSTGTGPVGKSSCFSWCSRRGAGSSA